MKDYSPRGGWILQPSQNFRDPAAKEIRRREAHTWKKRVGWSAIATAIAAWLTAAAAWYSVCNFRAGETFGEQSRPGVSGAREAPG